MKVIHRLLFVSAVLGFILGPVSIGAADSAMASSGMTMVDGMAGMDMPDMPCCPEQEPIKFDCGKACPLALLCTTVIVSHSATEHAWSLNLGWVSHRFLIMPHAELASSLVDPPARPPRL